MVMRQIDRVLGMAAMIVIVYLILNAPAGATEINRLNLDNADALGTIVSSDPKVKFEGKGSIHVMTKWPTTICIGQISELNLENAKLVYQANDQFIQQCLKEISIVDLARALIR